MPDGVTPPPFELATFVVNDVVEGSPSRWDAGRLHLDRAALVSSASDPALAELHLEVVRPGDAVRVANVLDAVLPEVSVTSPMIRAWRRSSEISVSRSAIGAGS